MTQTMITGRLFESDEVAAGVSVGIAVVSSGQSRRGQIELLS